MSLGTKGRCPSRSPGPRSRLAAETEQRLFVREAEEEGVDAQGPSQPAGGEGQGCEGGDSRLN